MSICLRAGRRLCVYCSGLAQSADRAWHDALRFQKSP
jgi:hypothetical protein